MQLSKDLAAQILTRANAILDRDVLVADTAGTVLAGKYHHGRFVPEALQASQNNRQIAGQVDHQDIEWCPFIYENQAVGVFGVLVEDKSPTPEFISLLQGLAEVIVHQYFLLDRLQSTAVMQADFLKNLLQAPQVDAEEAYRQADILQINIHSSQAVILVELSGLERQVGRGSSLSAEEQRLEVGRLCERINQQIHQGFKSFPDNVCCYIGNDSFVILKGIGGESLNTLNTIRFLIEKGRFIYELLQQLQLDLVITIGIGQYYPELGGLRKSYQDAQLALSVASKVWGTGRVYHIKQVGMFVTLANINQDRKAELAHQILHPLLKDQQLFKTVQAFLESGLNLTEAATKLHIHRNTLIYRLDKTKKLIGLDPRHFEDALQIKLGLMFY